MNVVFASGLCENAASQAVSLVKGNARRIESMPTVADEAALFG